MLHGHIWTLSAQTCILVEGGHLLFRFHILELVVVSAPAGPQDSIFPAPMNNGGAEWEQAIGMNNAGWPRLRRSALQMLQMLKEDMCNIVPY